MELWRKVFINRNYGLLFTGRLVSQLGDGIHYFAMVWLVLDLTGSGAALGTLLMAASIPGIALAPFSGVLADMWNRKKIIVGMDVIRGLLVLGLAGFHAFGVLTLPLLYIVTILLSLCGTLFSPAVSASVPGLVRKDQLVTANAREAFANSATGILGPILGAMLLGAFGTLLVFVLNGVSFLVSAASETCIEFPPPGEQDVRGQGWGRFLQNLKDGFSFLWNFDGLKVLIGGGLLLNFMFSPLFGVVFPFFGKEVLGMSASFYGFSQSMYPVGMLVGTLLAAGLAQRMQRRHILAGGAGVQGLAVLGLGIVALPAIYGSVPAEGILAALALPLLVMGLINVQVNVQVNTIMQERVPDAYRGRIFSLFGSLMQVAAPLGMGLFGVLLDLIPIHFFFLFCGLAAVAVAIGFAISRAMFVLCQRRDDSEQGLETPAVELREQETCV